MPAGIGKQVGDIICAGRAVSERAAGVRRPVEAQNDPPARSRGPLAWAGESYWRAAGVSRPVSCWRAAGVSRLVEAQNDPPARSRGPLAWLTRAAR
jgi:hypothetical protein